MTTLNEPVLRRYADAAAGRKPARNGGKGMAFGVLLKDRRLAVLAAGWLLVAAVGVALLVGGDPAGIAYLVVVVAGYLFLQSRWLNSLLWLVVAASGALQASQANYLGNAEIAFAALMFVTAVDPAWVIRHQSLTALMASVQPAVPAPAGPSLARATEGAPSAVPSTDPEITGLQVSTIGRFRLMVGSRDLTSSLLTKPMLAFIWQHLLTRSVLAPEERMPRASLADETAPGVDSESQAARHRGHVHELQTKLPRELAATIDVDRVTIRLDLSGARLDVYEIRHLESRAVHGRLVNTELATEIQALLARLGSGEFLPGFEELERKVTRAGGVAGSLLMDARSNVNRSRGNLAAALANHLVAVDRAASAVPVLEAALKLDNGREDLARLLVAAHVRCGQTSTADTVSERFGLSGKA